MIADMNFYFLINNSHNHYIAPGNFWWHFDSHIVHIINSLIILATKDEKQVGAFQEKFPSDILLI